MNLYHLNKSQLKNIAWLGIFSLITVSVVALSILDFQHLNSGAEPITFESE